MSFTHHSSYSFGELSSRAAASILLYSPLANILVPSLLAPYLSKYVIESLRVKCRFALHTLDVGFLLLLTPESGLWFELQTWSYVILLFDCDIPLRSNENPKWEQRSVRVKDGIHLTWVLYEGRDSGTIIRAEVRERDVDIRACCAWERSHWKSWPANICQIVIFVIWMVLFDPVAILQ